MKEIKIDECTIEVKEYLSYSEVQAIANKVIQSSGIGANWAERQQNMDILVLHFATNLSDEDIENVGHEAFLEKGVIEAVRKAIHNYDDIQSAIDYMESVPRALQMIAKQLPELLKPLEKVIKIGENSAKE